MLRLLLILTLAALTGCAAWRTTNDGADVTFKVEGRPLEAPVARPLPPRIERVHPLPRGVRYNCTGCHYRY